MTDVPADQISDSEEDDDVGLTEEDFSKDLPDGVEEWYGTGEAAQLIEVRNWQVRRWMHLGMIRGVCVSRGPNHQPCYRYAPKDIAYVLRVRARGKRVTRLVNRGVFPSKLGDLSGVELVQWAFDHGMIHLTDGGSRAAVDAVLIQDTPIENSLQRKLESQAKQIETLHELLERQQAMLLASLASRPYAPEKPTLELGSVLGLLQRAISVLYEELPASAIERWVDWYAGLTVSDIVVFHRWGRVVEKSTKVQVLGDREPYEALMLLGAWLLYSVRRLEHASHISTEDWILRVKTEEVMDGFFDRLGKVTLKDIGMWDHGHDRPDYLFDSAVRRSRRFYNTRAEAMLIGKYGTAALGAEE